MTNIVVDKEQIGKIDSALKMVEMLARKVFMYEVFFLNTHDRMELQDSEALLTVGEMWGDTYHSLDEIAYTIRVALGKEAPQPNLNFSSSGSEA